MSSTAQTPSPAQTASCPCLSISAYETVTAYLKKMRPILKSLDRGWEWNDLVAEIRGNYRNRPRFMEILDRLEARPILQKSHARK